MAFISLKEFLARMGLTTPGQFEEWTKAWRIAAENGSQESLLAFICRERGLAEDVFLQQLAKALNWPYLDLPRLTIPNEVRNRISTKVAFQYTVMPTQVQDGALQVAVSNPFDTAMLNAVRFDARGPVRFALATRAEIEKALKKYYGVGAETLDEMAEEAPMDLDLPMDKEITEGDQDASVIKFVNQVIWEAYKDRATDIHFEPAEDELRIRYRIDGVLHEVMRLPKYVHAPLLSRFKIMSGMNIAERRVPQDGRIHIRHAGKDYDLRSSVIPTTNGEKAVMRILDKSSIQVGLESLGLMPDMQARVEKLIVQPNGMILSTGPTGSGKTTTQYSILNRINSVETNIITIEDPVEYELEGISQVHVNRKAGLTFAIALKYFLRQDPDVILVGEIRDLETSEIAVQAALTGHLVLSTLHTNDAPSTVTRMVDMGVEPFLIASSIIASLSQRLARRICQECKEEYTPRRDLLLGFGFDPDAPENREQKFYRGVGCENCRFTGYRGRVGIYELMEMNTEIAELIVKRASAGQIKEAALAAGMVTLAKDGFEKALLGLTNPDDLVRVVFTAGGMG